MSLILIYFKYAWWLLEYFLNSILNNQFYNCLIDDLKIKFIYNFIENYIIMLMYFNKYYNQYELAIDNNIKSINKNIFIFKITQG